MRTLDEDPAVAIAYGPVVYFGGRDAFHAKDAYSFTKLADHNQFCLSALFRREAWEAVGGFKPIGYEDWEFWIACGDRGYTGRYVPEAPFFYRTRLNGRYSADLGEDARHKAQIVIRHPHLYTGGQRRWAEAVVAGDEEAVATPAAVGVMPAVADDLRPQVAPAARPCLVGPVADGPRVSVVIPCWNQACFLPEAVESVVAQTFRSFEIVVVDDGSPDDTAAVAQRLAKHHPDVAIRLLRQENAGLAAARNAGIAAAHGELVLPLDSDDRIQPDYLERLVAALDADGTVCGRLRRPAELRRGHGVPSAPGLRLLVAHAEEPHRRRVDVPAPGVGRGGRLRAARLVRGLGLLDRLRRAGPRRAARSRAVFQYRVRAGSMFDEATKRDQRLKAQIVLNHPGLYATAEVEWAAGVLAREPAALAIDGPLGVVPRLGGSPPRWSGERLADTRGRVILVLADELVAEPALGAAVRTGIRADEDVTVVLVDGVDRQGVPVAGLERALAAYDLDGDETPTFSPPARARRCWRSTPTRS